MPGGHEVAGSSPVTPTTFSLHAETVKALLDDGGTNIHADTQGWAALMIATRCGLTETVRILLAEGATAIANSLHMASLTSLDLRDTNIGAEGARAIANSPHMASLTSLQLWSNRIGDEGATAIANSPHMASLTRLDLSVNEIRDHVKVVIRDLLRQTQPKCVVDL